MAINLTQSGKAVSEEGEKLSLLSSQRKAPWKISPVAFFASKPGTADRMFFTEQLSLLLETGNSLTQSLTLLVEQTEMPAMQILLRKIIDEIENGKSFSYALRQFPDMFSTTYTNLIMVGENGGFMPKVLQELLTMDEKREHLRRAIRSAIAYPLFLLCFSMAVVLFVIIGIFPKFEEMFSSIKDELPVSTRFLMSVSQSLINNWFVYIIVITALILFFIKWLKSEKGQKILDSLKLSLPLVKTIYSELYIIQSLRVMGLSMANGVSIMDTLGSCHEVVKNRSFQNFVRLLEEGVQEGTGLAEGFKKVHFIPPIVRQMITTGEESGSLPMVMTRIATYYERQLEKRLTTLSKAAEPVMLLFMGMVVGILVSSLILPIFKISSAMG